MKKAMVYALTAASVLAVSTTVRAADKPEPLFPSGIDWKPGPICIYKINHNGNKAEWKREVTEAANGEFKVLWTQVSPDPSVKVPGVFNGNGLKLMADLSMVHGTAMTADPGFQWAASPLEPKTKWKTETVFTGTNTSGKTWKARVQSSYQAKKWQKVKTAAGEIMALRVDSKERITGVGASFRGTGNLRMWLGHGGCELKKLSYRNSFNEKATVELVSDSSP